MMLVRLLGRSARRLFLSLPHPHSSDWPKRLGMHEIEFRDRNPKSEALPDVADGVTSDSALSPNSGFHGRHIHQLESGPRETFVLPAVYAVTCCPTLLICTRRPEALLEDHSIAAKGQ